MKSLSTHITESFGGLLNEMKDDNFTEAQNGNPTHNFKVYKEIIQVYPHMQSIIEDSFKVGSPDYSIHGIWDAGKQIVFYFDRSCGISFKRLGNDLAKHNVSFQLPGNTDYNFNISIDK